MNWTSANCPSHLHATLAAPATRAQHRLRFLSGCNRAFLWMLATVVVMAVLWSIPGRAQIPPRIEQDNAYIFLAVDRLCSGNGLTSLPPKAPFQPWTWQGDWAVLTQWPAGYPLLIASARTLLGTSTAQAASALNVAFCALALVGWFAFLRACLPPGRAAGFLSAAAALSSVSMNHLINPASDTILIALTPILLLLTLKRLVPSIRSVEAGDSSDNLGRREPTRSSIMDCLIVGVCAGSLVWIRYSAIFIPTAVGAFLLFDWLVMRRRSLRDPFLFGVAAALPMFGLVLFNRMMGDHASTQEQFNLGTRMGFEFAPSMLAAAWKHFTTQTLYAYRAEAGWMFAMGLPVGAIALPMFFAKTRTRFVIWLRSERFQLGAACVLALVVVLVAANTLFRGKFEYVDLPRYYEPIKPLYFLLFAGPFLMFKHRVARGVVAVGAVVVCSWFIQQDGMRTRDRWLAANHSSTPYGRRDHRFGPNSAEVYGWVARQNGPNVAIFSNFHDGLALETSSPVSPIPSDPSELDAWLTSIRKHRSVNKLDVYFVLEFDDDSRDYFQAEPEGTIRTLGIVPLQNAPESIKNHIFELSPAGAMLSQSEF